MDHLNCKHITIFVKQIQWAFPERFGLWRGCFRGSLERSIHRTGAAYIWSNIDDMIRGSGVVESLAKAGVANTEAAAKTFQRASNPMHIRYVHQVICCNIKRAHHQFDTELDWMNGFAQ